MNTRIFALPLLILLVGCQADSGATLHSADSGMAKPFDLQQTIAIGQTTIPVEVKQAVAGGISSVSILSHGEELENEQYRVTDEEMDLVKTSDDTFTPPVPLMHFPASMGQTETWSGNVQEGATTRSATATIAISDAKLHEGGIPLDTLKVTVNLAINSGAPVPAKRTFEFWFGGGKLVKRVFGSGTTRIATGITN
ncbi:MAG TPA: hypothetical protein VGL56_13290 [Fimbriimonadaceae bacterium]|jgi:hypothetical protein